MTRFADPNRCPSCGSALEQGSLVCPSCHVDLSGPLGQELYGTLLRADQLVATLRERSRGSQPAAAPSAPAVAAAPALAQPAQPPQSAPQPSPTGMPALPPVSASSVPKILLTLGAVCLLVAGIVFLAVTWSVLGVAGRTVTLLVFTVGAGLLTRWVAGRGLRGATEALGLVTAGLVVLDLFGARHSGWLGHPSDAGFAVALGVVLVTGGLFAAWVLASTPARGFIGGEVVAFVGAVTTGLGLSEMSWGSSSGRLTVAVVLLGALAAGCWELHRRRHVFLVAAIGTTVAASMFWLGLVGAGVDNAGSQPTYTDLWLHLQVWPLLVAAALAAAVAGVRAIPLPLRVISTGAGVLVLSLAAVLPALDETDTRTTVALVIALVVLAAAMLLAPRPWGTSALGAAALAWLYVAVQSAVLVALAAVRYGDAAGELWDGTVGGSLPAAEPMGPAPWLLPLCLVVLVGAAWCAARLLDVVHQVPVRRAAGWLAWSVAVALGLGLLGWLLLSPVPVWTVVVPLLLVAVVAAGFATVTTDWPVMALAAAVLLLALGLGLYDEWLTLAAVAVSLVTVVAWHLRVREGDLAVGTGLVFPSLVAALAWTVGALTSAEQPWTALATLIVLALIALGRPLLLGGRDPVLGAVQVGCAVAAVAIGAAGVVGAAAGDRASWAALYLSTAGAAASAMALLRADRRDVGWIGGALLATASWVRLADLGVKQPEAYVLPSAVALLLVGLWKMRRDPETSTNRAIGGPIAAGLLPSFVLALDEPLSLRALIVGLVCLLLVAVGVWLRWSAPLVIGAVFGLVLVIWEAAPYVNAAVPRWALIGAAGAALIGTGITWEQRMQEARAVAGYVRRLR